MEPLWPRPHEGWLAVPKSVAGDGCPSRGGCVIGRIESTASSLEHHDRYIGMQSRESTQRGSEAVASDPLSGLEPLAP